MVYFDTKNKLYYNFDFMDDAMSPRHFVESTSTFITFDNCYESPDKNPYNKWEDMLAAFKVKKSNNMRTDLDSLTENARKKKIVLIPVWKYEHTGVAFSASDHYPFQDSKPSFSPGYEGGWDGGLIGVIYEKIEDDTYENVKEKLQREVQEYSDWANGTLFEEVYIYDENKEYIGTHDYEYSDEPLDVKIQNILETLSCAYDLDVNFDVNSKDLEEIYENNMSFC